MSPQVKTAGASTKPAKDAPIKLSRGKSSVSIEGIDKMEIVSGTLQLNASVAASSQRTLVLHMTAGK
jgi:hypothetical protein